MKKGFTLIELLIVIGILAVLSVTVILTLNPAELLRQARDSTRISDMATLKSAVALYIADVSSGYTIGTNSNCYVSVATPLSGWAAGCDPDSAGAITPRFTGGTVTGVAAPQSTSLGWVPVDFTTISSGAPISATPVDPNQSQADDRFYAYRPASSAGGACTGSACTTYEMNTNMESVKFATSGTGDVESNTKDGGNDANRYEVGTDSGLDL